MSRMRPDIVPTPLLHAQEKAPVKVLPTEGATAVPGFARVLRGLFAVVWTLMTVRAPAERGIRIRQTAQDMGGLWIKLAQLVALRSDVLPPDFCAELSKLHDRADGFPFEDLRAVVEKALRLPLNSAFSEFDTTPLAAASIGQVHRARLKREDVAVVVKIIKPNARALFKKDLKAVSRLAWALSTLGIARHMQWHKMVGQLSSVMRDELDYLVEMSHIKAMRESLARHTKNKVILPKVYSPYCSSDVLVMEYLDGVFMSDVIQVMRTEPGRFTMWCKENFIRPSKVARRLLVSTFRQVFEDNLFHGDLHPGNIVLFRNGKVGLIDFGSIGRLESGFVARYRAFLGALGTRDFVKAADMSLMLSPSLPPGLDIDRYRARMAAALEEWSVRANAKHLPYHERSLNALAQSMAEINGAIQLEPDWSLLKLGRTWATLDASLYHLDPHLDHGKAMTEYGTQYALRQLRALPGVLMGLPGMAAEYSAILAPQVRRSIFTMRSATSLGARMIAMLSSVASWVLGGGILVGIWLYLESHHEGTTVHGLIDNTIGLAIEPALMHLVDEGQALTHGHWAWLLVGLFGAVLLFRRMRRMAVESGRAQR